MSSKKIYMDHAATTPMRPEVLEAMEPYFCGKFGNPSGRYSYGNEARRAVETAREQVAALIGADPDEIYFTSGGTEGDNWAIREAAALSRKEGRNEIVTSPIEHHAVLESFKREERRNGMTVRYLPVDVSGQVRTEGFRSTIRNGRLDTGFLSVMLANNEVGTIQSVKALAALAKEDGMLVHTDAVQAVGNILVDVDDLGVDLLSMSAHKFYGPKGMGALYIRRGVKLPSLIVGGHQERDMRAGTENVPGIVGMGKAAELLGSNQGILEEGRRKAELRAEFERLVGASCSGCKCNTACADTLPGTINFSFLGVESEALVLMMDSMGVACSGGSACTSMDLEPSHVLKAMGRSDEWLHGSIRFSFGRETTLNDVCETAEKLAMAVKRLREMGV